MNMIKYPAFLSKNNNTDDLGSIENPMVNSVKGKTCNVEISFWNNDYSSVRGKPFNDVRSDISDKFPGEYQRYSKFKKAEQCFILAFGIDLDLMERLKDEGTFPYAVNHEGESVYIVDKVLRFIKDLKHKKADIPVFGHGTESTYKWIRPVFSTDGSLSFEHMDTSKTVSHKWFFEHQGSGAKDAEDSGSSKPERKRREPSGGSSGDALGNALISALRENMDLSSLMSEDDIKSFIAKQITEQITEHRKIEYTVRTPDGEKDMGLQHEKFETLLKVTAMGLPSLMVGPAGSGKSTAAKKVAEALDLEFYGISCHEHITSSDFFGYNNVSTGDYVETSFYKAVKHGGVFLCDEIDAGSPSIMIAINAALAKNPVHFPHETITPHEDFVFIAGANTWGTGADRQYVGRNQLDAATLDRFVNIVWDYDQKFEREIVGNDKWVSKIQRLREAADKLGVRVVISPRASLQGALLLAGGFSEREAADMKIFNTCPEDTKRTLLSESGVTFKA